MMLLAVTVGAVFTGCGDGSGEIGLFVNEVMERSPVSVEAQPVTVTPDATAPAAEQGIRILYNTGELTEEEERTALEAMQLMYQNLELEEYRGEGISNISSEKWMEVFGVRLVEGSRTYYLQEGGEILLSVQVGYDINGKAVSNVFYQAADQNVVLLKQAGSVTQLVTASTAEGHYDGAYDLWQFDSETGSIRHEERTYAAGVIVGEYTVSEREGTAAGSAYDLWNNRAGMTYEVTVLKYNHQGELISETAQTPAPTPTSTPAATSKPETTPRPVVTPKPVATPRPTPAPTPEPYNDDNDDDNDDGGYGGDNGSDGDNAGGGSSGDNGFGGDNAGGGSSGDNGSGGADVDVEWSGDIL